MDSRWPQWIHASLTILIKYLMEDSGIPVTSDTDPKPEGDTGSRLEFDWIGPTISEPCKGQYILTITLTVLVTTVRTDGNAHQVYKDQGEGQKALPTCIPVFKYGDTPVIDNEQEQLGILVRQGPIETFHIGHQDATNRIRQTGFLANYRMDL